MQITATEHIVRALPGGSSWPVLVETARGYMVVKLRGAAQGVPSLVAELVVAQLAEALGLPVPERVLVELLPQYTTDDRRDELADLLQRSVGLNVGFRYLEGAADLQAAQASAVGDEFAAATWWLDGLVMNPDRTPANPNILCWKGSHWLLDHGAALPFQYWWPQVTEDSPRDQYASGEHLFASYRAVARQYDEHFAGLLTRDVLQGAMDKVPSELLAALGMEASVRRTRAALAAFLWKRLAGPRPFL